MWPKVLDHSKEECLGLLRRIEVAAYAAVIDALRAGGDITDEKKAVLSELGKHLSVPLERHKTEIRRAVNDELLATIAHHVVGPENCERWRKEGRRIIPVNCARIPADCVRIPANL